jgi:hypothetical protein
LGLRDQLYDSLRKDDESGGRRTWRSNAYHRFFEGYSEVSVPKPNGKGHTIQRVYTGDYYRQDLTQGQRILIRGSYAALFLFVAYMFISSAILPLAINSTWYVVLPEAVSVPFLFWILIAFLFYLPALKDITIADYRSSSLSLQKATMASAISLGITVFAVVIFTCLNPSNQAELGLLCAMKYAACGTMVLGINRLEKKVNYLVIPSPNTPPVDSAPIE